MTDLLPYRPNVGAVIFNVQGEVLIARRSDMPGAGSPGDDGIWQFPQGGIDENEDPRQAVLREVQEEIGTTDVQIMSEHPEWLSYDLPQHLIGVALGGRYRGQTQKWFALRFTGRDETIRLDTHLPPEFDRWQWMAFDRIFDLDLGFKKDLYRTLHFAFAGLR